MNISKNTKVISRLVRFFVMSLPLMLAFQNCSDFELVEAPGTFDLGSISSELAAGQKLYTETCSGCHGPVTASAKKNRSAAAITLAISSEPGMKSIRLTPEQIDTIAMALNPKVDEPPPVTNDKNRQEFACNIGDIPKTPLVKLTNREYKNALFGLLDSYATNLKTDATLVSKLDSMPTDIAPQDRDTLKEQSQLMTAPISNALFEAAFRAGELVSAATTGLQNYPGTNQCLSASTITQACFQLYMKELGSRAFRRPLSATEVTALSAIYWDNTLSKTDLLKTSFTGVATMPDFVYKIYDRGAVTGGVATLTAHELATKLAFFLTGAPADATLKAAADNGTILTDAVISQHVDRLLSLNGGKDMIRRLFRESYGYDVFGSLTYDSTFSGGMNTAGLGAVMATELDNYFVEVVLNQSGSFHDVMNSRYTTFSDARLGTIYGVSSTTTLPAERAGFLNRAAMLTKRNGFAASPIKRGLHMIEHVLCQEIGLPPPSAPTALPPVVSEDLISTRLRTARSTEVAGSSCVLCHGRFNSLGYAFEGFDSLGRLRTNEVLYNNSVAIGSVPVSTAMTTTEVTGTSISASGSAQLVDEIGKSDRAMMCFVKHLKRFESRVAVDATANCQMNQSLKTMYGDNTTQGSVVGAIKALVMSPEFRRWKN